jgi:hypothetical protein
MPEKYQEEVVIKSVHSTTHLYCIMKTLFAVILSALIMCHASLVYADNTPASPPMKVAGQLKVLETLKINTKLGIDRYNELLPTLAVVLGSTAPIEKSKFIPRETEVHLVQCSFDTAVNLAQIFRTLDLAGYQPASFEHLASINYVKKKEVSDKDVLALGTKIIGAEKTSAFFLFKYGLNPSVTEPYIDADVKIEDVWKGTYIFGVVKVH